MDSLITLTCNARRFPDAHTAFVFLSHQIPHLMKRIRRAYPLASVNYFCVWERTRSGWPHVHVLFRGPFIPQRILSHHWHQLARSPVVDVRAVRQQTDVARYLGKYLTKQPAVPPGYRRFRSSRAFWQGDRPTRSPRDPDAPAWELRRECVAYVASVFRSFGYFVQFSHPSEMYARHRGPPPPLYFPEVSHGQPALSAAS